MSIIEVVVLKPGEHRHNFANDFSDGRNRTVIFYNGRFECSWDIDVPEGTIHSKIFAIGSRVGKAELRTDIKNLLGIQ